MSLVITKQIVTRFLPTLKSNGKILKTVSQTNYYEASWDDCDAVVKPFNIPVKVFELKPTWELYTEKNED